MLATENFDDFEKLLITGLKEVCSEIDPEAGAGPWTKEIKSKLNEVVKAQDKEIKVACHGLEGTDWGEWLYDMTFYHYNKSVTDIVLVVESEWKNIRFSKNYDEEIQVDFEKLVQARAKYKLMIFEAIEETLISESIERLIDVVDSFKPTAKGDRYVFAVWESMEKGFLFRSYIHA